MKALRSISLSEPHSFGPSACVGIYRVAGPRLQHCGASLTPCRLRALTRRSLALLGNAPSGRFRQPLRLVQTTVLAITALGVLACLQPARAGSTQTVSRVADLNPGPDGSYPTNLYVANGLLFMSAYTPATGWELWKYDGTNLSLVKDINDTVTDLGGGVVVGNSSYPSNFCEYGQKLYFSAYDPRRGGELWVTDGTTTSRAADINPDNNDTVKSNPNSSWPSGLTVMQNMLYFSANGGPSLNYELWRFDGSQATLFANIHPDGGTDDSSYPQGLTVFNNRLYFMADDGTHGYELWTADPTAAKLMADINPGDSSSSSYPKHFTALNNTLYFQAYDSAHGFELWKTDGTNVSLAADINPGSGSSNPDELTPFQGALYFKATDGPDGYQLWKYDGTNATVAATINQSGDSSPKNLTVFNNRLYFAADDGVHGWELWSFDGTNASLGDDLNPNGDSFPE